MSELEAASIASPLVLGRYRIVKLLARGGMGAVYLGRTEGAEGFSRPVVIKRVLAALADDQEIAQMFVREARILSHLDHPNIVRVLDFGQQGGGEYATVLEYVNGYAVGEWEEYMRRAAGRMPVDFALQIMIRVLDALEYAHSLRRQDGTSLQIVHRDVTPSNIMISDRAEVKLLDFGIARASGDGREFQTEQPRIKGKLPYLPLEIFQGLEATPRTDVYSSAVVLYELLTGSNPFAGQSTADIYLKVATAIPQSVHAVRDDAPEDIDSVLGRALNRDPALRFGSAAEFAQALRVMRRESEEVVGEQMLARARRDFAGPLPKALGLETLGSREAAWRGTSAEGPPTAPPRGGDSAAPSVGDITSNLAPGVATVRLAPSETLLLAAGAEAAPARSLPAHRLSSRRLSLLVALAACVGALAAAGIWLALGSNHEAPVVVVQRTVTAQPAPSAPQALKPAPPAPPAPAQDEAPAAEPPAAPPAAAEAKTAVQPAHKAPPPSAAALTRAFGRRQSRVEACFTKHAGSLPDPQLSLHFHVNAAGDVLDVQLEPSALASSPLGACLLHVAQASYFGPQQREVSFRIPITARKLE